MTLNQLIRAASDAYPEDLIWQCHAGATNVGDGLAKFIAIELKETFDVEASEEQQLEEAVRVLKTARENLDRVLDHFLSLQIAALLNPGHQAGCEASVERSGPCAYEEV